ncbi:hypothetical protein K9M41_01095 [Candidatus Gracilibacteria bacterium]|nr:hypothetical protein [Candidatus Gracilibacteria bacterium]
MQNDYTTGSTASLFSRFIIGFGAGFLGTVVLGIIIFLTWEIVGDTLSATEVAQSEFGVGLQKDKAHPLFLSIITLAIFLSTLVANLSHVFLSTIVDAKFKRRSTTLTQVFFGNLVILFLMLPIHLLASRELGPNGMAVSGVLHVILSTFFSTFVLEALHQSKYLIVNVYGTVLGIILFFFLNLMFLNANPAMMVLLVLPLLFSMIALGNRIAELFYAWLCRNYGTDFLNIDTKFGEDYGVKDTKNSSDFDI